MPKTIRSWWLEDVLSRAPAAPEPLRGDLRTDVCIVGGGFTGLWTALHVKAIDPSVDVTILEKDICGGGASGRNGGFCMTWMCDASEVLAAAGGQEGVRLLRAFENGVQEIGAFCATHDIEADFRLDGWLWTATNPAQVGAWRSTIEALDRYGLHPFDELSREELRRRSGSAAHLAGVLEAGTATLHPAKLARGLARVAAGQGIRIHEETRMRRLVRTPQPEVLTSGGRVRAQAVVLALNAWAHELPEFRRSLLPIAPDAVMSEAIPERLAEIGLDNGIAISDSRLPVDYYRTTADGRITLGKGGGMVPFAGRVGERYDTPSPRAGAAHARLLALYPQLRDVPVVAAWRGPATRTYHGLPFFGRLPDCPQIVYGHGYNGNGVGPSYTGGELLASLALGRDDEWSSCPLVLRKRPRTFLPPEPLRYIGVQVARAAVERKTRLEDEGRPPDALTRALAGLARGGTERRKARPRSEPR